MRFSNSYLKPFITDITIIKVATPMQIPINENHEIIDNNPPDLRGFRYLKAMNLSNKLKGTIKILTLLFYLR